MEDNFELDLEVQWTNVDYNEANEELCIYFEDEAPGSNNTYSLDATGGYMLVGDGTTDWGSTKGTISFWLKWDTFAGRPWGQHDDMETVNSGSSLIIDWGTSGYITSSSFSVNIWYFIAITWNEDTNMLRLFVGDQNNAPTLNAENNAWTATVSTLGVTQNNFMHSRTGGWQLDGHGDDLRYYNIDRSLAEIQSDYNVELSGTETNLRSYFKLNNNFDDIGPDNNDASGSRSYSFSTDTPFTSSVTEDLKVDVWDGAAWQNVISGLNIGWNNVTLTSYLTSVPFTIRFKGGTETNDSNQDSWAIDATLLHVWS